MPGLILSIKEFIYPQTLQGRFALRSALGVVFATLISFTLHLQNPFWATISVIIVMQPYASSTFERGILRIIGTIIGACLAFYFAGLAINSTILLFSFGFLLIFFACYFSQLSAYPYVFLIMGISGFMVFAYIVDDPTVTFDMAIWRCIEIITGVIVAWVTTSLVFPMTAKESLINCLNEINNLEQKLLINTQENLLAEFVSKLDKAQDLLQLASKEKETTVIDTVNWQEKIAEYKHHIHHYRCIIQNIKAGEVHSNQDHINEIKNQRDKVTSPIIEPEYKLIQWRFDKEVFHYAVKAGLSAMLALGGWLWTNWPGGLQGIISSVMLSLQKNIYDVQFFAEQRFIGCCLGGGIGLLCLHFFVLNIVSLCIILFVFCWIFSYQGFIHNKLYYIGLQANIALLITLVQADGPPTNMTFSLQRLAGVFIGIGASFLVSRLIWPSHPKKLLQQHREKIFSELKNLTKSIINNHPNQQQACIEQLRTSFLKSRQLLSSAQVYLSHKNSLLQNYNTVQNTQKYIFAILNYCIHHQAQLVELNKQGINTNLLFTEIAQSLSLNCPDINNPDMNNQNLVNNLLELKNKIDKLKQTPNTPQRALLNNLSKLIDSVKP